MEAIFEMIGALIAALFDLVLMPVRLAFGFLGMIIEFVILVIFQGKEPAKNKFRQRREAQREFRQTTKAGENKGDTEDTRRAFNFRRAALIVGLVGLCVAGVFTISKVQEHIRKKKTEATKLQIAGLADKFISQIKDDEAAPPKEGVLADRDAWNQAIELFVDQALLGSMVVVRSAGPDRESGTLDDLLAIRMARASATEVGGELAGRGLKAVRDRIKRMLPGKQQELPETLDSDEQ